jgi:hypothetical protein
MTSIKYIAFVASIVLLGNEVLAQTKTVNVVTTAVPFLQVPSDAVASGMAATGIATTPEANAVYWNQAKLPFAKSKGAINANYTPWLREWAGDMYLASLAGYYKISDDEAIHASVKYFNPGDLQFTDNNGNHLQSYHPNEFGINVGYSKKIADRFGLGLGIKYIRSNLAKGAQNGENFSAGDAIAADLECYYTLQKENSEGWAFGATLSNLGSKISYTNNANEKAFIPANLGLGASYTKVFDEQNRLQIGLDINKLLVPSSPALGDTIALTAYRNKTVAGSWFSSFSDAPGGIKEELKEFQISLGMEYWYNNLFALRAGYFYENKTKGNRKYFSAGAGLRYSTITVNFSYLAPTGTSASTELLKGGLQFGLIASFK